MSFWDSLMTAVFTASMVFVLLFCIYLLMKLSSVIFVWLENKRQSVK
jgi:hypothetical protein